MDRSLDLLGNALVSGLLLGAFYAAVTIGVSISFGMLDIVNIAHPAFIVLGSYIAYSANSMLGMDPILASIVVLPAFYLLGMAIYHVYGVSFERRGDASIRGLAFFFGILFITEVALVLAFGVDYRLVEAPYIGPSLHLGVIDLPLLALLLQLNAQGVTIIMIEHIMRAVLAFSQRLVARVAGGKIADLGIAFVPEGRRLFPRLTVTENLLMGAYRPSARAVMQRNLAFCFEVFPRLAERRRQLAGSMSGGEQQMLAPVRALMSAPRLLLIDEPSVGLAPLLVSRTIDKIKELKDSFQLAVLMAEQNFTQAIRIADRGYVIVHGRIEFEGESAAALNNNELIRQFYLGA